MKKALAITHVAFEDLGNLAPSLQQAGFSIEYLDACSTNLSSLDPGAADLLIVLGGPIGVYQTDLYPFLEQEIILLRERLAQRLPTLGICLGAQLIATALGARVYPGNNGKEIGWSAIYPAAQALSDNPLQALFGENTQVLHWHGDTFELPSDARLLASSKQYPNQAFALDDFALALQFHPEVQSSALERWYVGHACELAQADIDIPQLRAQSASAAARLEQQAAQLWQSWLTRAMSPR